MLFFNNQYIHQIFTFFSFPSDCYQISYHGHFVFSFSSFYALANGHINHSDFQISATLLMHPSCFISLEGSSSFQFYCLEYYWLEILISIKNDISFQVSLLLLIC